MKELSRSRWVVFGICVGLAIITWAVFGQTMKHEFLSYDDDTYVYANAQVSEGLTVHGLFGALKHSHSDNWHPLTTVSHMLDCKFYGLRPSGHHFTNILLDAIGTLLLFLVLLEMTGTLWRSAFVAAVFAVHPLHRRVGWMGF